MPHAAAQDLAPDEGPDLEALYRRHASHVLSAAYRVTGSSQDAEDVLQTVFLRLLRREGGPPLSANLGPYLRRAAVNAGLDVVRSRRSRRSTSIEEIQPALADGPEKGPDKAHGGIEMRDQIRLALATESPRAAEVFALRYFEGYENQEIARIVGSSRSTVAVILHRTRNRLRKAIAPYVGEPS